MKTKLLFAGLLIMTLGSFPTAQAQDFTAHQMQFTINGPVEFPGRILEAGTYFIRRLTTPLRQGTDSVIEVLDKNRRHVLLTTIAISTKRSQPLPEPFEFYEARPGSPPVVRAWYLPGQYEGYDFVYPKGYGAQVTTATPASSATVIHTAALAPAEPMPEPAPEPSVKLPVAEEPLPSLEKPAEPPTPAPAEPTLPATLPKTSGETALLVLVGFVFLIGLAAVRLVAKAKVD
jgi:hypothetical protein